MKIVSETVLFVYTLTLQLKMLSDAIEEPSLDPQRTILKEPSLSNLFII